MQNKNSTNGNLEEKKDLSFDLNNNNNINYNNITNFRQYTAIPALPKLPEEKHYTEELIDKFAKVIFFYLKNFL